MNMQTESAKEARKAFYCELCSKGYGRINDFEAHESSYDHLHKKVRESDPVAFSIVPSCIFSSHREGKEVEKAILY